MQSSNRINVQRGSSTSLDASQAVRELKAQIGQPEMQAVVFFCSSRYNLDELGHELQAAFPGPIMGCTTAGEVTSAGLQDSSLVGVSIASTELRLHTAFIEPLNAFGPAEAELVGQRLLEQLSLIRQTDTGRMFGFLLVDGLSLLEETVLSALYWQFGGMQMVGGSAGDDLSFSKTSVYAAGRFASNAAVFGLFETTLPFKVFKTQHFEPTGLKLVITRSDPVTRIVYEINGLPARDEYARALGLEPEALRAEDYSSHPLVLTLGGERFVRSVSRINPDASLTFLSAIENGLVLTVSEGVDMVANLRAQIEALRADVPDIQLVLGCDCILRRLEIVDKGLQDGIRETLAQVNFLGFSTYGEQFNATHVNQTLTGVAIGA